MSCCPFVEKGLKSGPPLVFMAGFPDNETSGWGTVVPEALGKKYRCIFMCLPDYGTNQDPLRFKPWGYEQEEVLTMMGNTLQSLGLRSNPYLMVAHDWGAFYALLYTTRNPSEVSKLILCDVGMVDPFALPVQTIPYIIFYQVYFAVVYVISQVLSLSLATTMFWALKRYFQFLMPTPNDRFHLPESEIRVQKCYPYYYLWRRLLTGSMLKVKFPACPLLFLYGTQKRCMFHDQRFLDRIDATEGCQRVALPSGHWFMVDEPDATLRLMSDFLDGKKAGAAAK